MSYISIDFEYSYIFQIQFVINPNEDLKLQVLIEHINIFQFILNIPIYIKSNINPNADFKLQVLIEYIFQIQAWQECGLTKQNNISRPPRHLYRAQVHDREQTRIIYHIYHHLLYIFIYIVYKYPNRHLFPSFYFR